MRCAPAGGLCASGTEDGTANVALLGGTTALLLLLVFSVVNIAVLILRKDGVDHDHFRTPTFLPVVGALTCAFLAGPWARSEENQAQYKIALGLLAVGVVLWAVTWFINRAVRSQATGFRDVDHLE